jgi:hypothetical protein
MRKIFGLATLIATLASLPVAAAEGQYLFDVMKTPTYRHAWTEMLAGAKGLPRWIGQIAGKGNYVATPGTSATIGSRTYRLFHACEAHNCAGNEFEVMFSADGSHAYGVLIDDGGSPRWFGAPDAEIQAALAKAMQE